MANVVCAWCKEIIRNDFPGEFESHGICDRCLAGLIGDSGSIDVAGAKVILSSDPEAAAREEIERLGFRPEEVLA
jgi:hypothetical protein